MRNPRIFEENYDSSSEEDKSKELFSNEFDIDNDEEENEEVERYAEARKISLKLSQLVDFHDTRKKKEKNPKKATNSSLLNVPVLKKRRRNQSNRSSAYNSDAESYYESDVKMLSLASPSNDRKSKTDDLTSSQSLNRGDGNLSSLSKRGELPPVNSDTDIHKTEHKKHVAATQRPPSGKKPRPITAKLRNQAQGEETSEKENSTAQARPKSGKTRPNSGVKRRSIPSRKDSLLKLQGGSASDDDDGTYGKANHDELEDYLVLKTDRKLPLLTHTHHTEALVHHSHSKPSKIDHLPALDDNIVQPNRPQNLNSVGNNRHRSTYDTEYNAHERETNISPPESSSIQNRNNSHRSTYDEEQSKPKNPLEGQELNLSVESNNPPESIPQEESNSLDINDKQATYDTEKNTRKNTLEGGDNNTINDPSSLQVNDYPSTHDIDSKDSVENNEDTIFSLSPENNDEKLENITRNVSVVKLTNQKKNIGANGLTIENDDESDEELRILMTKIGDDDPLSSATNIKEIPTLVKENANKDAKGKSPGGAKSHRSDIQHSEISDDVTDYDSTSVDISSDVPQSRVRKSTGSSWPEDTPVPADKNKSSNEEYSNLSNSKSTDEGKKISDKQPSNQTQSVLEIRRKYTPVKIERKTKSVGDMSEKGELIIPDDPLKAIPVDSKASTPKKRERRKSTWGIKDNDTPSDQTESQMSGDTSMRVSRTSVNSQNPDTTRSSRASDDNDLQLNLDENETESTYSKTLRESADSEEIANNENKKPKWHPPWQLKQEVIAHTDAIPVLVIDPSNRWFATGSADHTVKLWDINTCRPKLVIKAHKQAIRAMTFGATGHRQLFTTGDDRQLLCHDVEVNRVTAKFKGQSAVIYGISTYQPSHLLITAARDKLLKIYDTRSTKCIKTLRGHQNTVSCIQAIDETRQIVSGSHDSTLRLWDIGEGRCVNVLQGHVKSVRGLAQHPDGTTILSASSERILAWKLPTGEIVQEIQAENIAINSITINRLGVTVAGGSNGVMHLWDFNSAHRFQKIHRTRVYESQELPICVFATKFDHTGSKLICSDACNVVKIYREAFTKSRPILDVRYVQPSEEIPLGKNYLVPDSPKKE